jgi:hypothetical protein
MSAIFGQNSRYSAKSGSAYGGKTGSTSDCYAIGISATRRRIKLWRAGWRKIPVHALIAERIKSRFADFLRHKITKIKHEIAIKSRRQMARYGPF